MAVGVAVAVGTPVCVKVGVAVAVSVAVGVEVSVPVAVADDVSVAVGVADGVEVEVSVGVADDVGVPDAVSVADGVEVGGPKAVSDGVGVNVSVDVTSVEAGEIVNVSVGKSWARADVATLNRLPMRRLTMNIKVSPLVRPRSRDNRFTLILDLTPTTMACAFHSITKIISQFPKRRYHTFGYVSLGDGLFSGGFRAMSLPGHAGLECGLTHTHAEQEETDGIHYVDGSGRQLLFADGAFFDGAISTRFLHILPVSKYRPFVREMWRTVRPDGVLLAESDGTLSGVDWLRKYSPCSRIGVFVYFLRAVTQTLRASPTRAAGRRP